MHPLVEIEVEIEIEAEGASQQRFHHHLSVRWTALFWEESLLQRHFPVFGIEASGFHFPRSRGGIAAFHRVGGGLRPADLSHHRTYRSVYGGSLVFAFLLMQVCDDVVVFSNPHMDGHSGISLLFRSCFLPVVFFLKLSAFKPMVGYFH